MLWFLMRHFKGRIKSHCNLAEIYLYVQDQEREQYKLTVVCVSVWLHIHVCTLLKTFHHAQTTSSFGTKTFCEAGTKTMPNQ